MRAPPFNVRPGRDGDSCVLWVSGELDLATRDALSDELQRAEASDAKCIRLDLTEVTFIDSAALCVLIKAHRRSIENGRSLQLFPVGGQVRQLFELTGLMQGFEFVPKPRQVADLPG